eukprot:14564740-Ditylum_brightwellii.AAC.1
MSFTTPPLSVEFDWAANSVTSELLLEEDYSNSEIDFLQQKLFKHCEKEHDAVLIGEEVTKKEWKDKIRVRKEQTTTSPSGKHIGHYKALINCGPDDPKTYEGKDLCEKQEQLIGAHVDLLNYSLKFQYSYGRIVPSIANLIGRKKGLHRSLTFLHALTLAEAKFKLKTALDGSTNSPTIWLIISSTLFDIHEKLSKGAKFCDPMQIIHVHITMVGFVDDTMGQTNKFYDNNATPVELIHLMQHDAQL